MTDEVADKSSGTASEIIAEIDSYEREYQSWEKRGDEIVKRYRDEINIASTNAEIINRSFNILWANTEVLAPTLYARLPRVEVERRFKDKDPVGRAASTIAERCGSYILETTHTNEVLKATVQDMLLPGRGTAWVKYEAVTEDQPVIDPTTQQPALDEKGKPITRPVKVSEKIEPVFVYWKEFGHSPRRNWYEVPRVWRKVFMGRAQLVARFGKELGNQIPLDREPKDKQAAVDEMHSQATIYEVWCRDSRKVKWIAKTVKDVLEAIDPPIDLAGFWPCPRPLWSVTTTSTLKPVPLFTLYQDQAAELDKLTNRIGRLTDALKMVGVYDSSVQELQRILKPNGTPDNTLVPVENWAGLMEKGGIKGAVQFIPLDMVAAVLLQAYQARDQVKQTIYEITGLSDIIRGSTDARETLGAQQLKSQYGSIRIRNLQVEVARFSRDIARIVVEIVVEMYEPNTIYEMIGGEGVMRMEEFVPAMEMLRNDRMRSFHVDIETDSTIQLDDQADKQSAQEFVTVMGTYLAQSAPLVQASPMLAPLVGETLTFLARRFRAGRSLEGVIDETMAKVAQAAANPAPPQPDPKLLLEQERTKQKEIELQVETMLRRGDQRIKSQEISTDAQLRQAELGQSAQQIEIDKFRAVQEARRAQIRPVVAR